MTEDERQDLVDLSWRYAVLVRVTRHEGIFTDEIVEADRTRWGHLVKTGPSGLPAFDEKDALVFVREMSGLPEKDCLLVLREEWSAELCTSCNGVLKPKTDDGIVTGNLHLVFMECEQCSAAETRMLECFGESCPWCGCGG